MRINKGEHMIRLKKNDKLIVIIAVTVIIVAAIGIIAYESPKEGEYEPAESGEGNIFMVDWKLENGTSSSISGYASKKSIYEEAISISKGNLKSVQFNLSWVDDKAFLSRIGLDTLILEITTPDGTIYEESAKSAKKSKAGNVVIDVTIEGMPSTSSIETDDEYEAERQLNEEVTNEFTIRVGCKVGEILGSLRPRDKGNYFDLEISYEYYYASLTPEEIKETGSDDDSFGDYSEEAYTPPFMSMMYAGYGRLF